jgi:hypothetical protein
MHWQSRFDYIYSIVWKPNVGTMSMMMMMMMMMMMIMMMIILVKILTEAFGTSKFC